MDRTEEVKNVFLNAGQVNLPHSWKIICRFVVETARRLQKKSLSEMERVGNSFLIRSSVYFSADIKAALQKSVSFQGGSFILVFVH